MGKLLSVIYPAVTRRGQLYIHFTSHSTIIMEFPSLVWSSAMMAAEPLLIFILLNHQLILHDRQDDQFPARARKRWKYRTEVAGLYKLLDFSDLRRHQSAARKAWASSNASVWHTGKVAREPPHDARL